MAEKKKVGKPAIEVPAEDVEDTAGMEVPAEPEPEAAAEPIESSKSDVGEEKSAEIAAPEEELPLGAEPEVDSTPDTAVYAEETAAEEAAETQAELAEQPAEKPAPVARKPGRPRKKPVAEEPEKEPEGAAPTARELERSRRESNISRKEREAERIAHTSENQKFYAGISGLQEAQRRKKIMRGEVAAVEALSAAGTGVEAQRKIVMLSIMVEGRFKVMIPFEEFFRDNPIDMDTVDLKSPEGLVSFNRRQRQLAEKMWGATVDFLVTNVIVKSPNDYSIAGSRRQALEILEKRNYISADGGAPYISIGDTRPATILSVGQYNLFTNVGGVDVSIPLRDITYRYVTNLASEFRVGEALTVEIMNVKQRPRDGRVELEVNAKAAELREAKERQKSGIISEGTVTLGIITSIRQSRTKANKIVIHAYLPYFNMPAVVRAMDPSALSIAPQAGDEMRLRVIGFAESGFVLTVCHGFHNASRIFGRG